MLSADLLKFLYQQVQHILNVCICRNHVSIPVDAIVGALRVLLGTPSVLKNLTFRTVTRSPKHNFDLLSL
jgi:hypothetical protein